MGDYRARDWKPVERPRNCVEIMSEKKAVVIKPSLKFDKNGRLVR